MVPEFFDMVLVVMRDVFVRMEFDIVTTLGFLCTIDGTSVHLCSKPLS